MYDPKIARFLQEDTYRGDRHDPLSLHLYAYCFNNPLRYFDPTGHMGIDVEINGQTIKGELVNGKTEVGLRDLVDKLGGTVTWDEANTATVTLGTKSVLVMVSTTGRTTVALRDFMDNLDPNSSVNYIQTNGTGRVIVNQGGSSSHESRSGRTGSSGTSTTGSSGPGSTGSGGTAGQNSGGATSPSGQAKDTDAVASGGNMTSGGNVGGSNADTELPNESLLWPTESTRINSGYGWRRLNGKEKFHHGVDIGTLNPWVGGDPLYAVASGNVIPAPDIWDVGNAVVIEFTCEGEVYRAKYYHLQNDKPVVIVGEEVEQGQYIGDMGNTGNSFGNHLHFQLEVRGEDGTFHSIDPISLEYYYLK